jgi:diguanylate cyclase (GGDEF)-like protein/PAS domain S-box-containing protein
MFSRDHQEDERLHAARVAALFEVAPTAYITTLVAGGLLAALLWGPHTADAMAAWLVTLVALTLVRGALHLDYRRRPRRLDPARWEARFALGAFAAGAVWTIPALLFFPEGDPLLQMALIIVIVGSVIGAAGVYASSAPAFYGYSLLPVVGVMAELAQQPGRTYQILALMALVFGAAMVKVFRDIQRSVVATLKARFENDDLVTRLAQGEAQLRDAIESFPEGVAIYDAEDRLLVCNETYAQVYGAGRSAAQLAGTPYPELARMAMEAEEVPPEYRGRPEDWLADRLARRRSGGGAVRHYRTRDGRSLQGRFVRSRGGRIVSMFTDVTEINRAQEAYRRLVAEEDLILDTLPVGVAFVAERAILRCNRRLEQMLGYQPGELKGASTRQFYPTEEAWRAAGAGYGKVRHDAVLEAEVELARKDGSRLWCRLMTRAIDPERPDGSAIVAFTDIHDSHAAAQALRESESMFRNLVETTNDLVWSLDVDARWTYVNPAAVRRIYGVGPEALLGREFRELPAPELRERDLAVFRRVIGGEPVFDYETRHERRDGTQVDLVFNAVPLRDAAGGLVGATGTARDVTREKAAAAALHESVERLRLAVDAADLVYWEWDRDSGRMQFGRSPGASGGRERPITFADYLRRVHDEDRERVREASLATQERGEPYEIEFRDIDSSGRVRWMHARGQAVVDRGGRVRRVIGVSQDITDRKRREDEARFLAYHDTLTGLPNRRLLEDRLRQALYQAQRRDEKVAVMMVDLVRFRQVNDALGHRAGDAVLVQAAQRVAACLRKADTLARHGGDEFAIVIPGVRATEDCRAVAAKVLQAMEAPFEVDGRSFGIGACIGVSLFPADANDGEALLRNADVAMVRAKQQGRNACLFYGG